jgi:hypothetical protein
VISPFPFAQAHQLTISTSKNLHALFAGTTDNPMSFGPYPTKICYRPSFLPKCRVTGTMYHDMMEEFLITILEEDGPTVILQHDSVRLLKPKFPGHVFAGSLVTWPPCSPDLTTNPVLKEAIFMLAADTCHVYKRAD